MINHLKITFGVLLSLILAYVVFSVYPILRDNNVAMHWIILYVLIVTQFVLPFLDKKLLFSTSNDWLLGSLKITISLLLAYLLYHSLSGSGQRTGPYNSEIRTDFALAFSLTVISTLLLINVAWRKKIKIFICYRRLDNNNSTVHLLFHYLSSVFTPKKLFLDINNINLTDNYKRKTNKSIRESTVFLLVIGKKWLKRDWTDVSKNEVYREIKIAHKKKKIIPVYIEGARILGRGDLPADLEFLCDLQHVRLRPDDFDQDVQSLISDVQTILK